MQPGAAGEDPLPLLTALLSQPRPPSLTDGALSELLNDASLQDPPGGSSHQQTERNRQLFILCARPAWCC